MHLNDRWERLAAVKEPLLEKRAFYIHPGELLHTIHDHKLNLIMIDVRNENDYNLFHLLDAQHILPEDIPQKIEDFHLEPANTVFVVMSNDETATTEVWKTLTAESVPNVYILEGGINNWLDTFSTEIENEFCGEQKSAKDDHLKYEFSAALGSGCPAAYPDADKFTLEFTPKIELELKRAPTGGGCG